MLVAGTVISSAQAPQSQDPAKQGGQTQENTRRGGQTADRATTDRDSTYGRVKEFAAGQKLVIDINNAPDKSYDLTKEHDVVVAPGLKVGDPVKITEADVNGKKTVNIAMDNTPGVEHGDPKN
jgi:hypothetical protein